MLRTFRMSQVGSERARSRQRGRRTATAVFCALALSAACTFPDFHVSDHLEGGGTASGTTSLGGTPSGGNGAVAGTTAANGAQAGTSVALGGMARTTRIGISQPAFQGSEHRMIL